MSYSAQCFPNLIWETQLIVEKEDMHGSYLLLLCPSYRGAGTPPYSISGVCVNYRSGRCSLLGYSFPLEVDPHPTSPSTFPHLLESPAARFPRVPPNGGSPSPLPRPC